MGVGFAKWQGGRGAGLSGGWRIGYRAGCARRRSVGGKKIAGAWWGPGRKIIEEKTAPIFIAEAKGWRGLERSKR